ncbi:hypothetical protein ACTO5A_23140 [Pseudomonas aeruginosa]|uniref:Uncharacterized protein n=1 Tax=Ectopseudomonas oleovorans TaxID=301 RepID=A0A379PIX2_ECTOL|nr:hypothetical protein [Pseudomonas oleovorans]OWK37227.1 hypothetical protein PSOLE_43680 [Pseudomonas oleovorans subsp. oleovorans]SEJ33927.1 hypothetical protein SAMN05216280_10198 [Pseudomonas oleovorans]SUE72760.1 Uncharacterised protein [Pseudomonas oleovorans]
MQTTPTNAAAIVTAQLQASREYLEAMRPLDLPVMGKGTVVWGPAEHDKSQLIEYPSNWTGLAARYQDGNSTYWFLGQCQQTQEREFYCLGKAGSVAELIARAEAAVTRGIDYWSSVIAA